MTAIKSKNIVDHNNNTDDKKLKTVLNHKNLLKLKFRTK